MASKTAELRELTDDQLLERAESAKEELFNLRFQLATGQLDDSSSIKKVRHEIARIATVMRERDIEADLSARARAAGAPEEPADEPGTEREG
jgi:large subunit ribosomal protein L29